MLATELTRSGKFIVLERPDLGKLEAERLLTGASPTDVRRSLVGVDALILGSVVEFGRETTGDRQVFQRSKRQTARARVNVRLVDPVTSHVFFAADGASEASTEVYTTLGFGGQAAFDSTLDDKAMAGAVADLVDRLQRQLANRPWITGVLRVEGDQVMIAGGARQGSHGLDHLPDRAAANEAVTLRLLVATAALLLTGCATVPKCDYIAFFENHPRSILVVPAGNTTTAVDAPEIWSTTATMPLAERGYYVFPVYLTADLLKDLGLTNEGLLDQLAPSRFKDVFGAEAVLFVTIRDWSTKYLILASNVTVHLSYKLVDTRTGRLLWQGEQKVVRQSGGGGGGIGGLIAAAVSAALTTAIDYRPLAREANFRILGAEQRGLPAGPYHPEYQRDYAKYK
jgi:hypothetical protein